MEKPLRALSQWERLNFLLTNRIPRRLATRFMGWYSALESPLLTRISLRIWRWFVDDLDLSEARETRFNSLRACFIRQLREGARPIDPREHIVVSPCDAIVGACGRIQGNTLFQAKGFPYLLEELIPAARTREKYRDGVFVTLRLKSSMYHRFHAPTDCGISEVSYLAGDTWNVNPIALKRIEKLYCRNERAIIDLDTGDPECGICLVAVAAILVASIELHCLDGALSMNYRGPRDITCTARYRRGEELGYFQHGSTIIVLASAAYRLCESIQSNERVQMGQALLSAAAGRQRLDATDTRG